MKKVVLVGYGRMGKEVAQVLSENGYEIVGKVERGESFEIIKESDFVVEFALPEATLPSLEVASHYGKKYVLGTTGQSSEQLERIRSFGERIALVHSPNFSIGIALLKLALKSVAPYVKKWDVEIFEVHHRWKKDSPSGTALDIAKIFNREVETERKGLRGEEVGVFGLRGGDTFGEHTILIFGNFERLEMTHRLFSRRALAYGVLLSLEFLEGKERGYYSFEDVLSSIPNV